MDQKRVDDDYAEQDYQQGAAGGHTASGPVGEEPGAEGHHAEHSEAGENERRLTGSAMEGAEEVEVLCTVGDREFREEGIVDHPYDLQCDSGDGARAGKDGYVHGAQHVANSHQRSL